MSAQVRDNGVVERFIGKSWAVRFPVLLSFVAGILLIVSLPIHASIIAFMTFASAAAFASGFARYAAIVFDEPPRIFVDGFRAPQNEGLRLARIYGGVASLGAGAFVALIAGLTSVWIATV